MKTDFVSVVGIKIFLFIKQLSVFNKSNVNFAKKAMYLVYDQIVICMLAFFFYSPLFSFSPLPSHPVGDVYAVVARGPYNAGYD